MSIVFFASTALCLLYFLVIAVYSGPDTDFCGIWLAAAVLFFLMGVLNLREKKHAGEMPRRFPVAVYTSFALFAGILLVLFGLVHRNASQPDTDGCDYLIVEGDRVYEEGLSRVLMFRLDKAVEYKKRNPSTVLVVSGGVDEGDIYPEALAMYNYLVLKGVPENQIVLETRSDTTAESIRYSLEKIESDLRKRMIPPPIVIGVLTSDYHILRTKLVAERVCDEQLFLMSAPSDPVLFLHMCVRECFALVKDYIVGNIG